MTVELETNSGIFAQSIPHCANCRAATDGRYMFCLYSCYLLFAGQKSQSCMQWIKDSLNFMGHIALYPSE